MRINSTELPQHGLIGALGRRVFDTKRALRKSPSLSKSTIEIFLGYEVFHQLREEASVYGDGQFCTVEDGRLSYMGCKVHCVQPGSTYFRKDAHFRIVVIPVFHDRTPKKSRKIRR